MKDESKYAIDHGISLVENHLAVPRSPGKNRGWAHTQPATRLSILGVFLVMLLIAGCGGGSSKTASTSAEATSVAATATVPTTTTTTTTPASNGSGSGKSASAPKLLARADPICMRLNHELDVVKPARTPQEIARVASQSAALEQAALAELNKLTPPASMATGWQQILADRKTVIESLTKLAQYAATNDQHAEKSIELSGASAMQHLAAIAQDDGFNSCGVLG
jgi:hypothetical protein